MLRVLSERQIDSEELEEGVALDGYGNPFSKTAQELHIHMVLLHLAQPLEPQKEYPQVEWKDKPAGHYSKGSGI